MPPDADSRPVPAGGGAAVVFYHQADNAAVRSIDDCLAALSSAGIIRDLILVEIGDDRGAYHIGTAESGLEAVVLSGGQRRLDRFWFLLAQMPEDGEQVFFTVVTAALGDDHQRELARVASALSRQCSSFRPSGVVEYRVFIPEYGAEQGLCPAPGYFTQDAVNLIVLPVDQQDPTTTSVPVWLAGGMIFEWHAALSIAAVSCLWSGIDESSGLGLRPTMSGTSDPAVHLVRSWCVTARFVEPRHELMAAGNLPVPDGMHAAPLPNRVADAVDLLHPSDFQVIVPTVRASESADVDAATGPLEISRVIRYGLQRIASNLHQSLIDDIGGVDPLEAKVVDVEAPQPVASLPSFDPQIWPRLLQDVLGMADGGGGPAAAAGRRDYLGSESLVAVDRAYLTSDEALSAALGPSRPVANRDCAGEMPEAGESERDEDRHCEDAGEAGDFDDTEYDEHESEEEEESEELEEGRSNEGDLRLPELDSRTLLDAMSQRFQAEIDQCRDRFYTTKQVLVDHILSLDPAKVTIPAVVRWAPIAAVWVAIFALATGFPLLYEWLNPELLAPDTRVRGFAIATALAVAPALVALRPTNIAHGRIFLVAGAAVGAFATALVVSQPHWVGRSLLVGGLIVVGAAVLLEMTAFYSLIPNEEAENRRSVRLTAVLVLAVYLSCMIAGGINGADFNERPTYLFVLLSVATATFVVSVFIIGRAMNQIRRGPAEWIERSQRLKDDGEWEADRLPALIAIRSNWMGSAAALDYLIGHPYGRISVTGSSLGECRPQIHGLRVIDRETDRSPVPPGWLYSQYRRTADSYDRTYGGGPPEQSRLVLALEGAPLSAENIQEPRWDYARRLRNGEFDDLLSEIVAVDSPKLVKADREAMAALLVGRDGSVRAGYIGDAAARIGDVTMHTTSWLPPDAVSSAQDGGGSGVGPLPSRMVAAVGARLYQAVRVDVSDPILWSDLGCPERRPDAPAPPDVPPDHDLLH